MVYIENDYCMVIIKHLVSVGTYFLDGHCCYYGTAVTVEVITKIIAVYNNI